MDRLRENILGSLTSSGQILCDMIFGLQASLERVVENRLNSLTEDVGPMIR